VGVPFQLAEGGKNKQINNRKDHLEIQPTAAMKTSQKFYVYFPYLPDWKKGNEECSSLPPAP